MEGIRREKLIPRQRPDDDTLGSDKPLGEVGEKLEKSVSAKIEDLVPGVNMQGLKEVKPGLYHVESEKYSAVDRIDGGTPYASLREPFLDGKIWADDKDKDKIKNRDERIKEMTKFLTGKVVVDLGAGANIDVYNVARLCGARGYIGAELFRPDQTYDTLTYQQEPPARKPLQKKDQHPLLADKPPLPWCVVGEDMRSFLQRLPDNSVCITTFGIDDLIMEHVSDQDLEELSRNITRVLHPDGAHVYGSESVVFGENLQRHRTFDERRRAQKENLRGKKCPYYMNVKGRELRSSEE